MNPIDEIKSRLDIVEIIEESVPLRKTGRAYMGFCPFHPNTRTPAFTVYPDTQSFYCFGCHASGSVFDFVMRKHGLDFQDALKQLANRAGVQLKPRTIEDEQQDQQRTRLLEMTTLAARYFNYILLQHPGGQPGRDYVEQRDITTSTIEAFSLGYSLHSWDHLLNYMTVKKGFPVEDVVAAGLAIQHEDHIYDRFRGRLIFTIRNARGEVIGFGGRALGDAQPKYLNTPQTLLFDKGRTLYGLDLARDAIRSADATVVVEGYVDVLTAHQHGFRNVVAPLGTALTSHHAAMLKKLSHNVYFALDADAAGQRATLKGVSALQDAQGEEGLQPTVTAQGLVSWSSDLTLRIIKMPAGQDPDDVIKRDPQQWRNLVNAALPVMEFYIESYTADLDPTQPQQQRTAFERLLPLVARLDATQQRLYVARLEEVIGIRAELIIDMLRDPGVTRARRRLGSDGYRTSSEPPTPAETRAPHEPTLPDYRMRRPPPGEDYLLVLLLRYPPVRVVVEEHIAHDLDAFPQLHDVLGTTIERLFDRTENRIIWDLWLRISELPDVLVPHSDDDQVPVWIDRLDEHLRDHVTRLFQIAYSQEYRYRQDAQECIKTIRIRQVKRWVQQIGQQTTDADEHDEIAHLQTLLTELNRYLAHINIPRPNNFYDSQRRDIR